MPWLTMKHIKPHKCKRPTRLKGRDKGDLWQCGKCEQVWKILAIHSDWVGGYYEWVDWVKVVTVYGR